MPSAFRAHILLFLVNLFYAANYTIAKLAMPEYISAPALVVLRGATGTLVFFLIHSIWIRERIHPSDWPRLILSGLFGVAVNQMLFFKGLALTHPINASLIMITVPIMVLIVASVSLGERLTLRKVLGVVAGLAGAGFIIVSGAGPGQLRVNTGDVFILINATSYAIYLVMVKSLMVKYEPLTVMRWVYLFGFFMVIPFGAYQLGDVHWAELPTSAVWAIVYVLTAVTVLAYLFNALALRVASASLVSTYIYLQPLLATVIATGAGMDKLTTGKIFAGLLIFLGVYLVSSGPRKATVISGQHSKI